MKQNILSSFRISTNLINNETFKLVGNELPAIVIQPPITFYTSFSSTAKSYGDSDLPIPKLPALIVDDNFYLIQIIFKNRNLEVISSFISVQEAIQTVVLKYARKGGLLSAEFTVKLNKDIDYYNDMLIEFRTGDFSLGTVFSDKITIENGLLSVYGISSFNLLNSEKMSGYVANVNLKGAVSYFLQLILNRLQILEEPTFFKINQDKIIVDDSLFVTSLDFVDKSPVEIFDGLAILGGKIAYGIDSENDFYFIDQKIPTTERRFIDYDIFNERLSKG